MKTSTQSYSPLSNGKRDPIPIFIIASAFDVVESSKSFTFAIQMSIHTPSTKYIIGMKVNIPIENL